MPVRIQRRRTAGWRLPPNCKCCTRPGVFGNPFETAHAFGWWLRSEVILVKRLRDEWLPFNKVNEAKLESKRNQIFLRLPELRGYDLACWCGLDDECHVDVLLELANK